MSFCDSLLNRLYTLPTHHFGAMIRPVHRLFSLAPYSPAAQFLSDDDPVGLEIRPSLVPNAGLGLFTTRPFRQGESICEYKGTQLGLFQLLRTRDWSYIYTGEDAWIDAGPHENVRARYINDNFDQSKINCAYHDEAGKVWVRALRDIAADEELYAAYGDHYWAVVK
ncbi:MAG: SET domain-containing protein-lysine N-methyltransferase [Pontiellaceae bacterium]|nr:SET domain-containing protein-lysine N-methyltransferase [Pontiellaceae bacterium]MBN2785693.1 SET domain-containing protein-lysine N-methyltransferase [Pontiellaceae bacterium]